MKKKYPWYFYISLPLFPILFFILAEFTLQLSDYGDDYSTFVQFNNESDEYLVFNPILPKKYFNNSDVIPSVIPDAFKSVKDKNTFRIFTLGGSTTAGWPYPSTVSFPKFLKRKLDHNYPARKFEVINLGVSAINSFTVLDIIDDVISHEPDLILIYMGHNEFYGAYGAGSSVGTDSPNWLKSIILKTKKYRLVQFLENIISGFISNTNANTGNSSQTLMSKMVGESKILFESDKYKKGITQFEENLSAILKTCSSQNINTVIGDLVFNYKQIPFSVIQEGDSSDANKYYYDGLRDLENGDIDKAEQNLSKASDLDFIRFRSPLKFNEIILWVSKRYGVTTSAINQNFVKNSKEGIVGYNLMVDHLHPNIAGYKLMGDIFYETIIKENYISDNITNVNNSDEEIPFTGLDSAYVKFKVNRLLTTYPFVKIANQIKHKISPANEIESLALDIINKNTSWEKAHKTIADNFYNKKDYFSFYKEMSTQIADKPYDESAYKYLIHKLLKVNKHKLALPKIEEMVKYFPGFSNYKLLGNTNLKLGMLNMAVNNFNNCLLYDKNNAEVYFKLSSAYFFLRKPEPAFNCIKKCIAINPKYPNADKIYSKLKAMKK
ncbi:MAG: hypothetical protein JEY94_11125 [Melioribacteraceae bacterium]|nr:hypothetical protein [Melioribacteraceae bacterium]